MPLSPTHACVTEYGLSLIGNRLICILAGRVDDVFKALADPSLCLLLDRLHERSPLRV
jgi:hypothetical protein